MHNTILIAGGSGLIGTRLTEYLPDNYQFHVLSRSKRKSTDRIKYFTWDTESRTMDMAAWENVSVVINMAGAGIADKRWTKSRKEELLSSRIDSILTLKDAMSSLDKLPLYIGASAIGYYGHHKDKVRTETDDAGTGFLADVTDKWEKAHQQIFTHFDREVLLRIGIVLSTHGGALKEMLKPATFGVYGYFGNGSAYYSWVHIDDICEIIAQCIIDKSYAGTYNATAPQPVTIKTLVHAMKKVKAGFGLSVPVPSLALKLMLGEMTQMLTDSMRVEPTKLNHQGYRFLYTDPEVAIRDILSRKV